MRTAGDISSKGLHTPNIPAFHKKTCMFKHFRQCSVTCLVAIFFQLFNRRQSFTYGVHMQAFFLYIFFCYTLILSTTESKLQCRPCFFLALIFFGLYVLIFWHFQLFFCRGAHHRRFFCRRKAMTKDLELSAILLETLPVLPLPSQ